MSTPRDRLRKAVDAARQAQEATKQAAQQAVEEAERERRTKGLLSPSRAPSPSSVAPPAPPRQEG